MISMVRIIPILFVLGMQQTAFECTPSATDLDHETLQWEEDKTELQTKAAPRNENDAARNSESQWYLRVNRSKEMLPKVVHLASEDGRLIMRMYCNPDGSLNARDIEVRDESGDYQYGANQIWVIPGKSSCDQGPCDTFEKPPKWVCGYFSEKEADSIDSKVLRQHLKRLHEQSFAKGGL